MADQLVCIFALKFCCNAFEFHSLKYLHQKYLKRAIFDKFDLCTSFLHQQILRQSHGIIAANQKLFHMATNYVLNTNC